MEAGGKGDREEITWLGFESRTKRTSILGTGRDGSSKTLPNFWFREDTSIVKGKSRTTKGARTEAGEVSQFESKKEKRTGATSRQGVFTKASGGCAGARKRKGRKGVESSLNTKGLEGGTYMSRKARKTGKGALKIGKRPEKDTNTEGKSASGVRKVKIKGGPDSGAGI